MQGRTVVCWWQFWFIFPFSLVEIRYNSMFLATISSNLVGRNHIPVPWGPAFRDGSRCSHVQPRWSVATWPGHCPRKSSSGRKMAHVPRMMEVEGTWYTVIHIGFQWFSMVFSYKGCGSKHFQAANMGIWSDDFHQIFEQQEDALEETWVAWGVMQRTTHMRSPRYQHVCKELQGTANPQNLPQVGILL